VDKVLSLLLDVLLLDADIQPRETMSSGLIAEYAALYAEGHGLTPIDVYQEGSQYWVADGFHRVEAARKAGLLEIAARVCPGDKRQAVLHACAANKHGKALTREDKRRVVRRLLEDPEWGRWSDAAIARHCGVSQPLVSQVRKDLTSNFISERTYRTRHGTLATMETSRIGTARPQPVMPGHASQTDDISRAHIEDAYPSQSTTAPAAPPLILLPDPPPVVDGKRPTFNKTNEMVDWAKWTWNPVTGCLHTCVYCYARDMAERFYPEKFAPTFHPERLKAPHYTKVPPEAETQIGYRNVFVCSMADLFGKWVPQAWIDAVMDEVRAAPQWNFLFLTKFPQRLETIAWPQNAWVGTTVDEQYRVEIAERAFRKVDAPVKWLSCEPLRQRLTFSSLDMFDWVVLGGQSKSSQEAAFQPPWEWVEHLWQQARAAHCLVYWKANLLTRPQEYPGQRTTAGWEQVPVAGGGR
jgi:protein gp37